MKKLLLTALLLSAALWSQQPYSTVPSTGYPALEAVLNAKPAMQVLNAAPAGNCGVVGMNLAVNQGAIPMAVYVCGSTGWMLMPTGGLSAPFTPVFNSDTHDAICALGGDSSISGVTCPSGSATTATAFATTVVLPAGSLSATSIPLSIAFGSVSGSVSDFPTVTIDLDSLPIFVGQAAPMTNVPGVNGVVQSCFIGAPLAASGSAPVIASCLGPGAIMSRNSLLTGSAPYVLANTLTSHTLRVLITYATATAGNATWLQSISGVGVGAVGPQGLQGASGTPGAAGQVGATGPPGATGAAGSAGGPGATGAPGPTGSLGNPVAVTTTKTLSISDNFIPQDICGGSITINAPASLTGLLAVGWGVPLRNNSTTAPCTPSTVTVSGNGSQICGSLACGSSQTIPAYGSMILAINASGSWFDLTGGTGSSGAATWGSITGTLSSQTDLQSALTGKQASLGYTAENAANKDAASGYAGLTAGTLLKAAEMPALTGDCTTSAGAVAVTCGAVITRTIASGSVALGTTSISSAACATVVTATATGALTTDSVITNASGDISGVTGYVASASGTLTIDPPWLTAGQFNVKVCNNTAGPITPGAVSLLFRVTR